MTVMRDQILEAMDSVADWTAFDLDTINLATANRRVRGLKSVEFDKANSAANKTRAGCSRTFTGLDLSRWRPQDHICWYIYLSALTNVAYSFLILGTDASNCVEYRFTDTDHTAGEFTLCHKALSAFADLSGTGCDFSNITDMAVGAEFDAEGNALADIAVDHIHATHAQLTHT